MSSSAPRASPVVTSDRVWLSTLMYGSPEAEVAVVFGHGFTGSQHNRKVVAFVRHLADNGLAVYTADFRGHGTSGGMSTLGDRRCATSRRWCHSPGPGTTGS